MELVNELAEPEVPGIVTITNPEGGEIINFTAGTEGTSPITGYVASVIPSGPTATVVSADLAVGGYVELLTLLLILIILFRFLRLMSLVRVRPLTLIPLLLRIFITKHLAVLKQLFLITMELGKDGRFIRLNANGTFRNY